MDICLTLVEALELARVYNFKMHAWG